MDDMINLVVACNDGRTGQFIGAASSMEFEWGPDIRAGRPLGSLHLVSVQVDGEKFAYPPYPSGRPHIEVAGRIFPVRMRRTWPGSWACDDMLIAPRHAYSLLRWLESRGWMLDMSVELDDMTPPEIIRGKALFLKRGAPGKQAVLGVR